MTLSLCDFHFLTVDVPESPSKPRISNILATSATVTWSPPTSDGGSPVTAYIVEKQEDGRGRWIKCSKTEITAYIVEKQEDGRGRWIKSSKTEIPADATSFNVSDLNEGHKYEFRVSAVNKAGTGKPSAASEAIVAKPPYGRFT